MLQFQHEMPSFVGKRTLPFPVVSRIFGKSLPVKTAEKQAKSREIRRRSTIAQFPVLVKDFVGVSSKTGTFS